MTKERYASRVDRIYERVLKERIVETLTQIGETCKEAGYKVEGPFDLTCDEYQWFIRVEGKSLTEGADISIEIAESLQYEGTTDGINVGLSIVEYGGRILGGLTPYNYTPEVWVSVDDVREISERMEIIENAEGILECLEAA